MDSGEFICNSDVIPDTHFFVYRNKKFPIKYDFFKYSSNYFKKHEEEILENPNISLFDQKENSDFEISDDTIQDFINFVQCSQIKLTCQNIVGLHYLAIKFEILTLQKHTEDYIKKNHPLFVIDLLQNNETTAYFDKEKCEEIIASNLDEYIKDERLMNLKIPILYRILAKYHQKQSNNQTKQPLIEFLFKVLNKYGRQASILFSDIDFGDARIDYINRLLTEYSANFDFHFINSAMLQTLYDTHNEFIRREEEHRIEIKKLNDDTRYKIETQQLISDVKNEFLIEINKLNKEQMRKEEEFQQLVAEQTKRIQSLEEQHQREINQLKTENQKEIEFLKSKLNEFIAQFTQPLSTTQVKSSNPNVNSPSTNPTKTESANPLEGLTISEMRAKIEKETLTQITIPSSVTSIGDYAFSGCS